MSPSRARVGVSADAFVAVVRAYADRVHDDVRRLGCSGPAAAEVVETSALGLAERLRTRPDDVRDLVGAWFRDARLHADRVAGGAEPEDLAAGEGIVQRSADDAAARAALAGLGDRDRVALLLRDAYDLPYVSVAVALGTETEPVALLVARARLRFLRLATGEAPDQPPTEHEAHLATAARLADGQLSPDAVAGAERHAAKCPVCTAVVPAQRETRRLLSGLAIIAMADADRDALIARATAVARRLLPTADDVAAARGPAARGVLPIPLVAACLGGAMVLGTLIALAGSGGNGSSRGAPAFDPGSPTPAATASSPTPTPTGTPTSSGGSATPTSTASTRPPRQTATPSAAFSGYPGSESAGLSRTAGPNATTVVVTGSGWITGRTVTITYLDALRRPTGQRAEAIPDTRGRFTTSIVCYDRQNIPGPHYVRVRNTVGQLVELTYTAT